MPRSIKDISSRKAYQLIEENKNSSSFIIIDCRTPYEFDSGKIPGAINIDFYSPTFQQEVDKLPRENTYLIYCRTGNRSKVALNLMERMDFQEVYNLQEGIVDWAANGLPID